LQISNFSAYGGVSTTETPTHFFHNVDKEATTRADGIFDEQSPTTEDRPSVGDADADVAVVGHELEQS
jgi:hypothetical protein